MNAWEKIRKAIRNKASASLSEICIAADLPLETVTETLAKRDDVAVRHDDRDGDHAYSLRDFPPSLRAEASFAGRGARRAADRHELLRKEGIEYLPGAASTAKISDIAFEVTPEMREKVEQDRKTIRRALLAPSPRA